jgi:hypothetical protein
MKKPDKHVNLIPKVIDKSEVLLSDLKAAILDICSFKLPIVTTKAMISINGVFDKAQDNHILAIFIWIIK